jgi:hypothetical protein
MPQASARSAPKPVQWFRAPSVAARPGVTVSDRIRIIEDGIVLQDFSGLRVPADIVLLIGHARDFMEKQPKGEMLVLTDFSDSTFDREVANAMRALAEHHKPWVKASALVGLTPLMRMVYRSIVALTRRDIHVCDTRAEAIAYLLRRRETHAPGRLG